MKKRVIDRQLNLALVLSLAIVVPTLIYHTVVTARTTEEPTYAICDVVSTNHLGDYTDLVVELPDGSLHVYEVEDVDFYVDEVCLMGDLEEPKSLEVVALR